MNDNLARTIKTMRVFTSSFSHASLGIRPEDVLALCDAAERGMSAPPSPAAPAPDDLVRRLRHGDHDCQLDVMESWMSETADAIARLTRERDEAINDADKVIEIARKVIEITRRIDAKERDALRANADIGRKVRALVDGGPFDLTDSPKSFIETCRQLVAAIDAARGEEKP